MKTSKRFTISQMITLKDTDSLKSYLDSVSKIPLLSEERESQLGEKALGGSQEAINELVVSNLRFVISVAKKYQYQGLPLEDLINEGNLGLVRAAQRFEPQRGYRFITCALWWIRQAIVEAITVNGRAIRLPLNRVRDMEKIRRAINLFFLKEDRNPNLPELVDLTGLSEMRVITSLKSNNSMASIEDPLGEEDFTLGDTISDNTFSIEKGSSNTERESSIQKILSTLGEKEKEIIEMTFGIGRDEMEVEDMIQELGIGKERIRQIRESAIRKLKGGPRGEFLRRLM